MASSTFTCPQCQRDIPSINQVIHLAQCRGRPTTQPPSDQPLDIATSTSATVHSGVDLTDAIDLMDDDLPEPIPDAPSSSSSSSYPSAPPMDVLHGWACSSCTYVNDDTNSTCAICGNSKYNDHYSPPQPAEEVVDVDDSIIEIDDDDVPQFLDVKWTCEQCTFRNEISRNYCDMCNHVRPGLPSYRDRLIPEETHHSSMGHHHHHTMPEALIFESALFGAGLGASIGGGMALLNGRSMRSGVLEGAGYGALGGLLMHTMMEATDEHEMADHNMFARHRYGPGDPRSIFEALHQSPQPQRGLDSESMSQLPTRRYRVLNDKREQCSICLENFQDGESVRTLPCLHQFHERCVDQWLSKSQQCPVCKHEIRS